MTRPTLKHALLSRLMVSLLVAGLAVQWMTNAVGMGGNGTGIVSVASLENVVDQVLTDLAQSICSKGKGDGGQAKAAHCQQCVPAAFHLLSVLGTEIASPVAMLIPVGLESHSQILPPSRRLPGDGPSRAPPSIA